jgi:hypothetical protein
MSVDLRSRTDGPREAFDPAQFFDHVLPAVLDVCHDAVAPGVGWLDLRPMTIELDGDAWTLSVQGDRVHVETGIQDDAPGSASRSISSTVWCTTSRPSWACGRAAGSTGRWAGSATHSIGGSCRGRRSTAGRSTNGAR